MHIITRLTNEHEFVSEGEDFTIFDDKVNVINLQIPEATWSYGKRKPMLTLYFRQYLTINKNVTDKVAIGWLRWLNDYTCTKPVTEHAIQYIWTSTWGKDFPTERLPNKKKAICFREGIPGKERQQTAATKLNERRGQLAYDKAKEVINREGLDISAKKLADILGVSLPTARKHLKKIKTNSNASKEEGLRKTANRTTRTVIVREIPRRDSTSHSTGRPIIPRLVNGQHTEDLLPRPYPNSGAIIPPLRR